ncbi:nectin-2 isoform X2 [Megalops cyprinoides]|uniref:nectin-2 isoform X2 n=1 Tax=Megalops cyprinoides TaxID=118141 RepID=UPI00186435E0|nr:nectin-2 isoform X2 [Megalops cyprinoides]
MMPHSSVLFFFDFRRKNVGLVVAILFAMFQGTACQKVRVEPEVVSYPGQTVTLRCNFVDASGIKLTQVSWIWEPTDKPRDNIAVYHPQFGASYPDSPLSSRIRFLNPSLENPSIEITGVKMTDEGKYTCEYATYPSGNEQGTTSLIMLAKPKNTASAVTVPAGTAPVVVARCESADGRPAAEISWVSPVNGNGTTTSKPGTDNTVTVTSEYRLVPTSADNGKDISCVVKHRTLDKPQSIQLKLAIEYSPKVMIVGYDNNWYVGRTNAMLTCQATGNPVPTTVTWKVLSGLMPDTVQIKENKLTVLKVDDSVNTTFVCEVKNRLGVGKDQVTVVVRGTRLPMKGPTTGSIIGAIIGVIILLAIIATAVVMFRKHRQTKNVDAPPNYKPPPPKKTGGSTEILNQREPVTEVQPLSTMYYETSGEPVTDLDACNDEENGYNVNSNHADWEDSTQHPGDDTHSDPHHMYDDPSELIDHQEHEQAVDPLSRASHGDSFVSPAMYV